MRATHLIQMVKLPSQRYRAHGQRMVTDNNKNGTKRTKIGHENLLFQNAAINMPRVSTTASWSNSPKKNNVRRKSNRNSSFGYSILTIDHASVFRLRNVFETTKINIIFRFVGLWRPEAQWRIWKRDRRLVVAAQAFVNQFLLIVLGWPVVSTTSIR